MEKTEYKVMPCLVLDLDGTVRRSKSGAKFIKNADDIELIPGMAERVTWYKKQGYLIVGVTNQGGVAHGFKDEIDVMKENHHTHKLLGESFDYMVYCPFMEDANDSFYGFRSLLRKPDIGMLAIAERYFWDSYKVKIDWDKSLFVGDREEDELCAAHADVAFCHASEFVNLATSNKEFIAKKCVYKRIDWIQSDKVKAIVDQDFLEKQGFKTDGDEEIDEGTIVVREYSTQLIKGLELSLNYEHDCESDETSVCTAIAINKPFLVMSDSLPSRAFVLKLMALFKEYKKEVDNE